MTKYELIALGAGFVLGAVVSSIITGKVVEKRKNDELTEEINKVKQYYLDKYPQEKKMVKETKKESNDEEKAPSKFSTASIDYHPVDTHQTPYVTIKETDENYEGTLEKSDSPIRLISWDEACNAEPGWDMEYLKFYLVDEVLTDNDDQPVDETLVGDACEHFGDDPDNPGEIFVANSNVKKIYDILTIDSSYYESIMDLEEYENAPSREKIYKKPKTNEGGR